METNKLNNFLLFDYLIFFGSYLLVALFGSFIESNSSVKMDLFPVISICGSGFMIIILIVLNRRSACLRDEIFYLYNLLWVSLLILFGLITEHTLGFSAERVLPSEYGVQTIISYDTIYYHIFVFIIQASTVSTFILLACSIAIRKLKPIIMTISTLALIFLYFLMTV